MIDYPYLQDSKFLREIDELPVKEQWVKITLLDFATEKTLQEIQGQIKNGSFNLNGKSCMRRTAQFSMVAEDNGDITNINNLISINKKVNLEIGITNTTFQYSEYPIIWYPLGLYVITEAQVNRGKENITISVNLKDKMCLLNGECGGTIPAAATLSEYDTIDASGQEITKKITIVQLIQEIVNHYGGEQLGNIIISDLDTVVKQVMMWNLDVPLYYYDMSSGSHEYNLTQRTDIPPTKVFSYGQDIGFIYTDFTYPGQLTAVAGDTVCTILDKIISVLGNFEYFYDVNGKFIFQEIKNNLNTSQATIELGKTVNSDYLIDLTQGTSEYDFSNSILIKTFSNNPHFNNIKNDYLVWGVRKSATGMTFPIRFHLAIDQKPNEMSLQTYRDTKIYLYNDEVDNVHAICSNPLEYDINPKLCKPKIGVENYLYEDIYNEYDNLYIWTLDKQELETSNTSGKMFYLQVPKVVEELPINCVEGWFYKLSTNNKVYKCIRGRKNASELISNLDCFEEVPASKIPYRRFYPNPNKEMDWRTVLYLQGTIAGFNGIESNYYYAELANEWPKMYNIETYTWNTDKKNLDFYLDFIDTDSSIGALNVTNIGRRSMVVDDKNINCIFENDIVDCIIIEKDQLDTEELEEICVARGQDWSQVDQNVYENMVTGGTANAAYEIIKNLLYQYTSYNETVAISVIPMYHLQPGIRVTIQDTKTGIYGDYMINSISCNLETSGTMNISCTRCLEKI